MESTQSLPPATDEEFYALVQGDELDRSVMLTRDQRLSLEILSVLRSIDGKLRFFFTLAVIGLIFSMVGVLLYISAIVSLF